MWEVKLQNDGTSFLGNVRLVFGGPCFPVLSPLEDPHQPIYASPHWRQECGGGGSFPKLLPFLVGVVLR